MVVLDFLQTLLTSGATVAALKIIDKLIDLWAKYKTEKGIGPKAVAVHDCNKCEEVLKSRDEEIAEINAKLEALAESQQKNNKATIVNIHDRIKYLCRSHIETGEISFDDQEDLILMHEAYHSLGGNGHLDVLMGEVKKLPHKPTG